MDVHGAVASQCPTSQRPGRPFLRAFKTMPAKRATANSILRLSRGQHTAWSRPCCRSARRRRPQTSLRPPRQGHYNEPLRGWAHPPPAASTPTRIYFPRPNSPPTEPARQAATSSPLRHQPCPNIPVQVKTSAVEDALGMLTHEPYQSPVGERTSDTHRLGGLGGKASRPLGRLPQFCHR